MTTPGDRFVQRLRADDLLRLTNLRDGEVKVGEKVSCLQPSKTTTEESVFDSLKACRDRGVQFAVFGIPEDIGPRANFGRGGSHDAFQAFLSSFLQMQSTNRFTGEDVCIIGTLELKDLMMEAQTLQVSRKSDLKRLRDLVACIDERVCSLVQCIHDAGLTPLAIGGGHNNVYPIHKGVANNGALSCINIDPHADLRALEGRHSGNGFSYSLKEKLLSHYYVFGLHESYNSASIMETIACNSFQYRSYDDIRMRNCCSFQEALDECVSWAKSCNQSARLGLDVDLDSLAYMPVSAETPLGFTLGELAQAVYTIAFQIPDIAYLHLPEGSPSLHHCRETGSRYVGRALATLLTAFVKGRNERG